MSETQRLYKEDDDAIDLRRVSSSSTTLEDLDDGLDLESLSESQLDREILSRHQQRLGKLRNSASRISSILGYIGHILTPSFLQRGDGTEEKGRGGPNGALDGLRGVACLIVAVYHYFSEFYDLDRGYEINVDYEDGGPFTTFFNYPIIKAFHNGPNMVAIFLAISGYVLSHRFITLCRKGDVDKALGSMPSSIFRRWMRLFAPVGVSFAIVSFLVWAGAYDYAWEQREGFKGVSDHKMGPFPVNAHGAWEQFKLWFNTWRHLFHSFTWERFGPVAIDADAWTVSVEYRCSIVVFTTLIALARVKKHWIRLSCIVLVAAWALNWEQRAWEVVLFLGGMFWAEINISNSMAASSRPELSELEKTQESEDKPWWHKGIIWGPVVFISLYGASVPGFTIHKTDPGLGWWMLRDIDPLPPSYTFNTYQFIGAFGMIGAVTNWEPMQWWLNSGVAQYSGRLSYALYLTHGPLLKWFAWTTVSNFFRFFQPRLDFDAAFHTSAGLGFLFFIPVAVYVADMFMRFVDEPSVRLSKAMWDYAIS